jgi:hypothetical protein
MPLLSVFVISLAVLRYQVGKKVGDANGYARGYKKGREARR